MMQTIGDLSRLLQLQMVLQQFKLPQHLSDTCSPSIIISHTESITATEAVNQFSSLYTCCPCLQVCQATSEDFSAAHDLPGMVQAWWSRTAKSSCPLTLPTVEGIA